MARRRFAVGSLGKVLLTSDRVSTYLQKVKGLVAVLLWRGHRPCGCDARQHDLPVVGIRMRNAELGPLRLTELSSFFFGQTAHRGLGAARVVWEDRADMETKGKCRAEIRRPNPDSR